MRKPLLGVLAVLLFASWANGAIADFALLDDQDTLRRLSDYRERRFVVLAFLGVECPLAKLYAGRLNELAGRYQGQGVAFAAINSNADDRPEAIRRFAVEHACRFPILRDPDQRVADAFGATRQMEVFALDERHEIRYHGRVDDQYGPGTRRPAPLRDDLAAALDELLAGKQVSVAETPVVGCFLSRAAGEGAGDLGGPVTYEHDIQPLLAKHCVECHRPGRIGPFSLTGYQAATAWADTIREQVAENKMPPWHADPRYGHFANERRLTDDEKRLLFAWIDQGRVEGMVDAAARRMAAAEANRDGDDWNIGAPDRIYAMPRPFVVPAAGVLETQVIEIDPGFSEDQWIRGAEVRPGAPEVVHHLSVFVAPPGQAITDGVMGGVVFFADYVPGFRASLAPAGMAQRLPAGWHIYLHVHYVPCGVELSDQSRLGLVFADGDCTPVWTNVLFVADFSLRPFADNQRLETTWTAPDDVLLLSLRPHMHLRGKSFRYDATYPDGRREPLLSVPQYDFMWQHQYVLAEPKPLPKGTVIQAVGVFDNSAANANNPDPAAWVRRGPLSTDEMFNGLLTFAQGSHVEKRNVPWMQWSIALSLAAWLIELRRTHRRRGGGY